MRKPRVIKPKVKGFFDKRTFSIQYVVSCPTTKRCAVVDPVFDYDEQSGATDTRNADAIVKYVEQQGLKIERILDTHPHADHFSAAQYLKRKTASPTAIGDRVRDVQKLWAGIYNWPDFPTDGPSGTACSRMVKGSRSAMSPRQSCSLRGIHQHRLPT
jgi:glyoxylase-like metal-dependent hydrolase (beta-lactamase superfamily II)